MGAVAFRGGSLGSLCSIVCTYFGAFLIAALIPFIGMPIVIYLGWAIPIYASHKISKARGVKNESGCCCILSHCFCADCKLMQIANNLNFEDLEDNPNASEIVELMTFSNENTCCGYCLIFEAPKLCPRMVQLGTKPASSNGASMYGAQEGKVVTPYSTPAPNYEGYNNGTAMDEQVLVSESTSPYSVSAPNYDGSQAV